ncbi:hypothetical protein KAR91_68460 [Candidatus Pacearchaeota archaeon]|nr:hypothetical protein [Candidatus Pacearchaeota archaeon]
MDRQDKQKAESIEPTESVNILISKQIDSLQDDFEKFTEHFEKMDRRVRDLHTWHNQHDEDGAFKWYIKKSLESSIKAHAEAAQTMASVLGKLVTAVDKLHRERGN